jgi:hypothetical protein
VKLKKNSFHIPLEEWYMHQNILRIVFAESGGDQPLRTNCICLYHSRDQCANCGVMFPHIVEEHLERFGADMFVVKFCT